MRLHNRDELRCKCPKRWTEVHVMLNTSSFGGEVIRATDRLLSSTRNRISCKINTDSKITGPYREKKGKRALALGLGPTWLERRPDCWRWATWAWRLGLDAGPWRWGGQPVVSSGSIPNKESGGVPSAPGRGGGP